MAATAGKFGPEAILSATSILAKTTPVTVYNKTTTTAAHLYTSHTATSTGTNPVNTDNHGNLTFYATPGIYTLSFTVGGVATTVQVQVLPWYGTLLAPPQARIYSNTQIGSAHAAGSPFQATPLTVTATVTSGAITVSTSTITIKVAGDYLVGFRLVYQAGGNPTPTGYYEAQVWKNGTQVLTDGRWWNKHTTVGLPIVGGSDLRHFAVNDALTLHGYAAGFTGTIAVGGGTSTHPSYLWVVKQGA